MQNKSAGVNPRNFNPMSAPGLSDEARKAVNAAFDAMSTWRSEIANNSEKNIEQVIEKMAAAARALGWPEQIVDAARAQMQSITKMQIQTMDRMMDAWEEQVKSPNAMTEFPVGDAVEAEVLARLQPGRRLAERGRPPNGGDEPDAVLDANGGGMAESLGRGDGVLGQGRQAAGWRRTAPPLKKRVPTDLDQRKRRTRSARAMARAPTYPPPCGEGRPPKRSGGGRGGGRSCCARRVQQHRPPPPTPPHKGEGSTPSVRHCSASNPKRRALISPFALARARAGTQARMASTWLRAPLTAADKST